MSMLAYPTGRPIDEREPYDADMPRIIRKARATGGHLELNAHPERSTYPTVTAAWRKRRVCAGVRELRRA